MSLAILKSMRSSQYAGAYLHAASWTIHRQVRGNHKCPKKDCGGNSTGDMSRQRMPQHFVLSRTPHLKSGLHFSRPNLSRCVQSPCFADIFSRRSGNRNISTTTLPPRISPCALDLFHSYVHAARKQIQHESRTGRI